jgi:hypothetical protein
MLACYLPSKFAITEVVVHYGSPLLEFQFKFEFSRLGRVSRINELCSKSREAAKNNRDDCIGYSTYSSSPSLSHAKMMRMAKPLVKSFVSTKRLLTVLVFVAVCLSFQGFVIVLYNKRVNGEATKLGLQTPNSFQEEKARSLFYVSQLKSTRRTLKFFHIPKAAGTAIEHVAGEQLNMPWGSCLFNHRPKRTICNYPPSKFEWPRHYGWWHLPAQLFPMGRMNPYDGAELFAVVRDPFDRLVSEVGCVQTLFTMRVTFLSTTHKSCLFLSVLLHMQTESVFLET